MIVYKNISQLITVSGFKAKHGKDMNDIHVINNGAFVVNNDKFVWVGEEKNLPDMYKNCKQYDCNNCVVMPSFIDSHTHLVFGGYRAEEFNMRMNGASYMEIMQKGGGIEATTKLTNSMSEDDLYDAAYQRLIEMKACGIGTVEIKSGYGLNTETELKQLRVIKRLQETCGLRIIATFMGAHAIASNFNKDADKYADYVINEMLPEIKKQGIAQFCDVFCERNVFNHEQTIRILNAGKKYGLKSKVHADEMADSDTAYLATQLGCQSADHLLYVSDKGIKALAESDTIATLLPATAFSLREQYAPAKKLIDNNAAVAIASDFNPGSCFCNYLPLLISLSVLNMNMKLNEVITALTLNAAAALNIADKTGSIDIGKIADFIILKWPNYNFLSYHICNNSVMHSFVNGKMLF